MTLEASKIMAATTENTFHPVQKPQKIVEKPKKSGGNLKNHLETNREIIPIFKISEIYLKSRYSDFPKIIRFFLSGRLKDKFSVFAGIVRVENQKESAMVAENAFRRV